MPKYAYLCHHCEEVFEVRHSLGKEYKICNLCDQINCLQRIPSPVFLNKKNDKFGKKNKAGSVVKEAIKDIKEELSQEREMLSNRMYKKDG